MSKKIIGATVATPLNPEKFGSDAIAIDFSNFKNGSFTETVDGEIITHTVILDADGRPTAIDGVTITWGDADV